MCGVLNIAFVSVIKHLTHMLILPAKNYGTSGFGGSVSNALIDKMGSFQNEEVYGVEGRSRKSSASDVNCSFCRIITLMRVISALKLVSE
jgi:hypothetical protein